jgi:acetoin utilization deacetylase AcuC-like enzyme
MDKFQHLRDILIDEHIVAEHEIVPPETCPWDTLRLVHTERYLDALRDGAMGEMEVRKMGLPWSEALVRRSRLAVQGTINAFGFALEDGLAANLAGGTHHAHPDFAQGFCVLNDVAVAIREHQRRRTISTVLVIDLDTHQGNGTAHVFEHDHRVYTFSMHGGKNFPLKKARSTRDVPLDDNLGDDAYLRALDQHLPASLNEAELLRRDDGTRGVDLVVYVQGVDVCEHDKFGRLNISRAAMIERDRRVLHTVSQRELPLVLLLGGGYALPPLPDGITIRKDAAHTLTNPQLTAHLHADMHRAARDIGLIERARKRRPKHDPAAEPSPDSAAMNA